MTLKQIRKKINSARKQWADIEKESSKHSLMCVMKVSVKKDNLKNLLEDTRSEIDSLLQTFHSKSFIKTCKIFLENLLAISENLRMSYVFPEYTESYYILDTLKMIERASKTR